VATRSPAPRPGAVPRWSAVGLARRIRHDRRTRPLVAFGLIAVSIFALATEHARVDAARRAWGPGAAAWVTVTDLDAGHRLDADDVVSRMLPPGALPDDAVTASPVGLRLADPMGTGEVVRQGRLRSGTASPTGSAVPAHRGAITLPVASPHLAPGDWVDLHSLLDGHVVASDGEVVAVTDGFPLIAVDRADLPGAIRALAAGDLVPAVVG
jgi:Flp pilus assembly protein CpaB